MTNCSNFKLFDVNNDSGMHWSIMHKERQIFMNKVKFVSSFWSHSRIYQLVVYLWSMRKQLPSQRFETLKTEAKKGGRKWKRKKVRCVWSLWNFATHKSSTGWAGFAVKHEDDWTPDHLSFYLSVSTFELCTKFQTPRTSPSLFFTKEKQALSLDRTITFSQDWEIKKKTTINCKSMLYEKLQFFDWENVSF